VSSILQIRHLSSGAVARSGADAYLILDRRSGIGSPRTGRGLSIVNFDNNQHAANENVRIRHIWEGIESMAALLTMP
jgi:hypothetical protein